MSARLRAPLEDTVAEYKQRWCATWVCVRAAGLQLITEAVALVGIVRFLSGYYIHLITRARLLGTIGSHQVFGPTVRLAADRRACVCVCVFVCACVRSPRGQCG